MRKNAVARGAGALRLRVLVAVAAVTAGTAAAAPPDFTGVWSNPPAAPGAARNAAPQLPPFKPEAARRVAAYQALVTPLGETPGGVCLGHGMPGSMMGSGGYPMEIIQRPEQITIIYELHGEVRRVYFGDRNAPEKDRIPGRNGYSSGRWEGETLVVETDNLVDQVDQRYPHSAEARIVERYSLAGQDAQGRRVLKVDVTMTDPAFYTEPVRVSRTWIQVPNGRLLPYDCNEEFWHMRLEELSSRSGVPLP